MNKFEEIKNTLAPFEWGKNKFGAVNCIGTGKTFYPYSFTRENSKSLLFVYTVSGKGFLEYKGNYNILEEGDVFFIDCREFQKYGAYSDKWDFLYTHLNICDVVMPYYLLLTENGSRMVFHYPSFEKEVFLRLKSYIFDTSLDSMAKASVCIVKFILNLLLLNKPAIPDNIKRTAGFIREHCGESINVERLAQKANLSKYYFIRCFKRYYGSTPHEYTVLCRLENAKNFLVNSDTGIEEIAEICGFSSASAFSVSFKNSVGLSPTEFRKQFKML